MRYRAGIVVYCEPKKSILLIHRKKGEEDYWVVPGGGLETNESFEEAAKRELMEEIGILIEEMSELCTISLIDRIEKYYISYSNNCNMVEMHGEELIRSSNDNIYEPTWLNILNLPSIYLLPDELKNKLIEIFL